MIKSIIGRRPEVKPLVRGFSHGRALGYDCETFIRPDGTAEINSLQFAGDDFPGEVLYVTNKNALAVFMSVLDQWTRKETINTVWSHNAAYDLTALFLEFPKWVDKLADGYLKIEWPRATLEIFSGRVWFAKVRFGNHRRADILDTFNFTFTSLEKSAKLFNVPFQKLPKPDQLGIRRFHGETDFEKYALTDAAIAHSLGEKISEMHAEFNVPLCVSLAQLSGRVFRKHFLKSEVARPCAQMEQIAIDSFHGGVSLARPGFYEKLQEYDICSAYPEAMAALGVPSEYRYINSFGPLSAVYYIRGRVTDFRHPALFSPGFHPLIRSEYSYVTGYELAEAFDKGEFRGKVLDGVEVKFSQDTALKDFVDCFFAIKAEAKVKGDKTRSHFYKKILNSLYGKMIQTMEVPNSVDFRAGGLWTPFLATLITGFVRAKLHNLEHESESVHASTDAVKTELYLQENSGLGGLTLECSGPCLIIRPKLYAHYDNLSHKWKFASHGLNQWPPELAWKQLWMEGRTKRRRCISPKTAKLRKVPVLSWIDVETKERAEIPIVSSAFDAALVDFFRFV